MRERNSNSRTRSAACGGDRDAVVLDFEFLSRPAPPSKQWRNPHSSAGLTAIAEDTERRHGRACPGHPRGETAAHS